MSKKSGMNTGIAGPSTADIESDSSSDGRVYSSRSRKPTKKQKVVHKKKPPTSDLERAAKMADIRFCIYIAEVNRSFKSCDHLARMMQAALPNCEIAKGMSLRSSNIPIIIQNVISKYIVLETTQVLQDKYFSVLIHETYDAEAKMLCILMRYVHREQVYTDLLDLIRITECSAEDLYKCFLYSLKKHNLSLNNIIGVSIDNPRVMLERQNAFVSQLLRDNEEMTVFPWICYSLYFIACDASSYLPLDVRALLHSVYEYYSGSLEEQRVVNNMIDFMGGVREKNPHLSEDIEWLAVPEIVERIASQWTGLLAAFEELATTERLGMAKPIIKKFKCPYNKAYLQFLKYVLHIFTGFNTMFQTSKVIVHCLLPECFRFLRSLAGNFIKYKHIATPNLHEIDVYNNNNLLPLQSICIGQEALVTINDIRNSNSENTQGIKEFFENIKRYYQSAFENIVKKLPFNEKFLNSLEFLNPHVALGTHQNDQVNCILSKFKSKFNSACVLDEWRLLTAYFSPEEKEKLNVLSIPRFWHKIGNIKDFSGKYKFENIAKVAQSCLILPYSNADVDRFFTIYTEIRTNKCDKLKPKTIAALSRLRLFLNNKNLNSVDYKLPDKMVNLFNDSMYEEETVPKELAEILLLNGAVEYASDDSDC